jgi:Transposase IS4
MAPRGNLTMQDMQELQNQGIMVDDDNQPAEENNVGPEQQVPNLSALEWDVPGLQLCRRRMNAAGQQRARFKSADKSVVARMSNLELFQLLFPMEYVESVIIVETNKMLRLGPLSKREFFVWIGLWFYMSCFEGVDRRDWWAKTEPNMEGGAPFRFNDYMTRNRFNDILQSLEYTNRTAPTTYKDPFFLMRQMEEAWNKKHGGSV